MWARASSRARCLMAICAAGSRCCMAQPPQTPKWGQGGATRCEDGRRTRSTRALSKEGLRRVTRARTRSPGSAPSMKTTLPSWWAIPWPSRSSDSTSRDSRMGSDMGPGREEFFPMRRIERRQCVAHQGKLGRVGGGIELALDQAIAAVHQPGIDHVGLAVVAHVVAVPGMPGLPYLAAVHVELARETA